MIIWPTSFISLQRLLLVAKRGLGGDELVLHGVVLSPKLLLFLSLGVVIVLVDMLPKKVLFSAGNLDVLVVLGLRINLCPAHEEVGGRVRIRRNLARI